MDEDLAIVSESTLLLAIGLLNHSDDEGYFRAHEGLIKAAVFPLREPSVSIQYMLNELSEIGYIKLFKGSDGKSYGLVCNFEKHQRINRPTPSKIKELESFTESSVSTHEQLTIGKEQGKERNREHEGDFSLEEITPQQRNGVPFNKIIELYHEVLPELPSVEKLTEQRKGFIRQRWQEDLKELEHWRNYFDFVRRSDFLMGRSPPREGKKPFRADLEWLTRPGNYAKIAEEKYHG